MLNFCLTLSNSDEHIFKDLKTLSEGKIDLNTEGTILRETKDILAKNKRRKVQRKK